MLLIKHSRYTVAILSTFLLVTNLIDIADAATAFNNIKGSILKQNSQSYVGLRYRNVPRGLKNLGGWVVGNYQAGHNYAITHVQKENQQMLWFEIFVSRDNAVKATFQVIDVLNLPKLNESEQLGNGGLCLLQGVRDPEIVAIELTAF